MRKSLYFIIIMIACGSLASACSNNKTAGDNLIASTEAAKTLERTEDTADNVIYYTDNIDYLNNQSTIENSYIRDRITFQNHYYIDENNVLWGTGKNQYWQLGMKVAGDINNLVISYSIPVRLAERVVHVDASDNGDYLIYLTEDNQLYGLGANLCGVLRQPILEWEKLNPYQNIVGTPVLLMEAVKYAAAGRNSIASLTSDGKVWWWGHFNSTTGTKNPGVLSSLEPRIMVENARFIACGADFAAAIDNNNNLWTWGNNVWGQCGINSEEDLISEATNVAENIDMVWTECLSSRQNNEKLHFEKDYNMYIDITYPYTMFVRTLDKNYYACGIDLEGKTKSVSFHGDINIEDSFNTKNYTHSYSSQLIPVSVQEAIHK